MIPAVILAAAAEGEAKSGLPQLNPESFAPQLIWLAITYGFLYLALSWFILPRIGQVIEERRNRIQRDLDEAESLRNDTDAAIAAYEQALADARSRASTIAKETRDRLSAETDRERARVEDSINAKMNEAEQRIGEMKQQALSEVDTIAAEAAAAIVAKLVDKDVAADEIRAAMAATGNGGAQS